MVTKKSKSDNKPEIESSPPVQIFDVARPGTLPPADATSRPVIVTNRAVIQDPMMASGQVPDLSNHDADNQPTSKILSRVVIKPLTGEESAATDTPGKIVVKTDTDADGLVNVSKTTDEKPVDKPAEKPAEPVAATPPDEEPVSAEAATPHVSSSQTTSPEAEPSDDSTDTAMSETKLAKEAAELEADAKAEDELDTLVEQKTYFLPINAVEQRRNRHVFIFGMILIIILVAAWLNIAMDAGFVSVPGLKPITHLFQN